MGKRRSQGQGARLSFRGVERWDGWVQLFVAIGGGVVAGFDVGEGDDTWQQRG